MVQTSLRTAIANHISCGTWKEITETCERLGLSTPPEQEEKRSKHAYAYDSLEGTPPEDYLNIAIGLYNERRDDDLRRAIVPLVPKQIQRDVRRRIIEELTYLQSIRGQFLQGTLSPSDFLERTGCQPSLDTLLFSLYGMGKQPERDITPNLTPLLEETDDTFLDFLRLVLHPTTRFERGQQSQNLLFLGELVVAINKHLPSSGFRIKKTGALGSDPLFEPVAIRVNPDEVRCVIFAAAEEKPDIVIADVLSLDVAVHRRVASKYLVYQTAITGEGLRWNHLTTWWAELNGESVSDDLSRALYGRLAGGLQSEHERNLLYAYCKGHPITEGSWPALLPQFYLRWDPFSGRAVKVPQRYDFLLLLPNGVRIVLEIDGIQHYAVKSEGLWNASSDAYRKTVADTRELTLMGYEVYRFAASELATREYADVLVREFFPRLFERHKLQ